MKKIIKMPLLGRFSFYQVYWIFFSGYSSLSGSLNEHYIYYHFGIYVYALGISKKYFCN